MVLVSLFDIKIFPFLRISLRGLSKAIKSYIDNVRIPAARQIGGVTEHCIELNLISPRLLGAVTRLEPGIEFSMTVVNGVPLPKMNDHKIGDATGRDLAPSQRAAYIKIFQQLQLDSGAADDKQDTLDVFEIQKGLKELGHRFTIREVEAMMRLADREADQASELRTSTQRLVENVAGRMEGTLQGTFQSLDNAKLIAFDQAARYRRSAAADASSAPAPQSFLGMFSYRSAAATTHAEIEMGEDGVRPTPDADGFVGDDEGTEEDDGGGETRVRSDEELINACQLAVANMPGGVRGVRALLQSWVGGELPIEFKRQLQLLSPGLSDHEFDTLYRRFRRAHKTVKWKNAIKGDDGMFTQVCLCTSHHCLLKYAEFVRTSLFVSAPHMMLQSHPHRMSFWT